MRKLIIAALAGASILAAVATANAGVWINGVYYPTCGYVWTVYGPAYVCG